MEMDQYIFNQCSKINSLIESDSEIDARNDLIKLLEYHENNSLQYSPLVNHLIRETGLYPYIQTESADWQDRFVYEAFKVDNGAEEVTLHREQALLLKAILNGESVAVSAPTSFGKSFIIDAYISINKPKLVVIIVPTIALMDETRRRLYKKFSNEYKIITTADTSLADKNILIFPQERALSYLGEIESIDLLVVDEFYKASNKLDKGPTSRAPSLVRALLALGKIAKQKYFIAPNIKSIKDNPFTKDLSFINLLNFNTVFLEKHEVYKKYNKQDKQKKSTELLKILAASDNKSLIYAGNYTNISELSNLINTSLEKQDNKLLRSFSTWLANNYNYNWPLVELVKRETGIHNGNLHRSLAQIQIKLFEEPTGLKNIISTSSIIEGVNTSAQNVIIWHHKNGRYLLNDFTYKNIIGRGGRMFKHFVGKIYLLVEPPREEDTELDITIPETLLADINEDSFDQTVSQESINAIITIKEELRNLLGVSFDKLLKDNVFQTSDANLIKTIAEDMQDNPLEWNGLSHLNSSQCDSWERFLYKVVKITPSGWDIQYYKFVQFVKILSSNWELSIPDLLEELEDVDINIEMFFNLEKKVTYNLSALLSDINELQKILINNGTDISPFISKTSHAFLPKAVFQLEEYGLPRMISKKIHTAGLINFEAKDLDVYSAIIKLQEIGQKGVLGLEALDDFDAYIVKHFYDGISKVVREEN